MCENFPIRKEKIMHNKDALLFFPGGIGTLDEFMDFINLQKTNFLTKKTPIILVGNQYWLSLKNWFEINNIDFELNWFNKRLFKIFVLKKGGVRCSVEVVGGGLSEAEVYKMIVYNSQGNIIFNIINSIYISPCFANIKMH